MNNSNYLNDATKIKGIIKTDPNKVPRVLVEFAKEYAVDNSFIHRAIVLSNDYVNSTGNEARLQLNQQVFELIDEIVADQKNTNSTEKEEKKKKAKIVLEKYYHRLEPKKEIVVQGKALNLTYKKSDFSISDLDIELRLGEITGVVGENANGKTTLFEIIVGNVALDSGTLSYPYLQQDGKLNWHSIKSQIAYVPQTLPRWHGSLKDNLHFEAAVHGIKGKKNKEDVDFIIHRFGLLDYIDLKWQQLSGGYKMRFALARSFVWKPKLMVLDEPLAHLDVKAQLTILNDIKDLSRSLRYPVAVIISSQHLGEIESIADNLIFLKEGRTLFNGKRSELGSSRKENTFEFNTSLTIQELEDKLMDFQYLNLSNNGLSFIITTSPDVTETELLENLISRGINISYFRNISQSSKQLFR